MSDSPRTWPELLRDSGGETKGSKKSLDRPPSNAVEDVEVCIFRPRDKIVHRAYRKCRSKRNSPELPQSLQPSLSKLGTETDLNATLQALLGDEAAAAEMAAVRRSKMA